MLASVIRSFFAVVIVLALTIAATVEAPVRASGYHVEEGRPPVLIMEHENRQWALPLKEIGFDGIDPTTLDRDQWMDWISLTVESVVNRPPVSARFVNRKPVPHQDGVMVDRDELELWPDRIHDVMGRPVHLPVKRIEPALTLDRLIRLKEKRLATYTTWYNPRNVNRAHNIRLSVASIDHKVVMPGEIFSFNQTVGVRTPARGYRPARIIVKGEYSEGVGGGICQTSSTLYNCVDKAGLKIVQRVSHSRKVGYVPSGRDATVSWGGPDFRFQNQLDEPVLIVASANGGRLSISVYAPRSTKHMPRHVPQAPGKYAADEEEAVPDKKPSKKPVKHTKDKPLKKANIGNRRQES
ncbi:VanW family protein [Staphylospora marina]|uniref:VanW family protein n=1 Tax=Staphylospora marina TaxID=2490858 RepID=UPI001F152541|nr:VanW family protein [Staphylospora marina]